MHFADGRLEIDRTSKAPRERVGSIDDLPVAPEPSATARTVAREGKKVNQGLDALDWMATACGLVGVPIATLLHPRLQEVIGGGWIGLTLATFTWTVGCALAVAVVRKSGLIGYPLLTAVSGCYVAALVVASVIGRGVLEIAVPQSGLGPFNFMASVVASALVAYGPAGFVLCGGIGTWLGFRLSAHLEDNFLH